MSVVLVFTDLHEWDKNIRGRKNYLNECDSNLDEIFRLGLSARRKYGKRKLYCVFLGDLVHREFKSIDRAIYFYSRMTEIRSLFDDCFFVVGNHDITYSNNNPTWSLIKSIESSSAPVSKNFAKGRLPLLRVLDFIDIDGVRLHFIHHGSTTNRVAEGRNLGFAHDTYLCEPLITSMETKHGVDLKTEYTGYNSIDDRSFLRFFDEVFFGHQHLAFGSYTIEFDSGQRSGIHYLGSLGLTNKEEVRLTPRTRNIPVIEISDGDYNLDSLVFNLADVDEILDLEQVKKNEDSYIESKQRKLIRKSTLNGEDPVDRIETLLAGNQKALEIFNGSKRGEMPPWLMEVL